MTSSNTEGKANRPPFPFTGPQYEVRPWSHESFSVYDARVKGTAWDDTWLTREEADRRAAKYNAQANRRRA